MRGAKTVSEETLQRLCSEIALLRQEVAQAERDQSTKLVIVAAKAQLQSRSDRSDLSPENSSKNK
jgi:hypothetical protein